MSSQPDFSFKPIFQKFPALGQVPGDPHKHDRRDRRIDARKRCESDAARWRTAQINGVIAGLERMVNTLEAEIQAEQVRSGVSNPAQFNYPTIATALIKRRVNATRSIDMLRRELTELERVSLPSTGVNIDN
jgi:hypothetical protein